jgi:Lectin C-type domain
MRAALLAIALVCGLAGCLRSTQFTCDLDGDCTGGRCEPTGFCSFADPACTSGSRYGELSGSLSNTCVAESSPDAGAEPDALPACAAGYDPLPGAPNRYRVTEAPASWFANRGNCNGDGGYLAIPNDLAELTAIVARVNPAQPIWVGLTDQANENTFVTVLGAPATFLPWDAGEPNDLPGAADCVRATPGVKLADDRCSTLYRAVCECGPP